MHLVMMAGTLLCYRDFYVPLETPKPGSVNIENIAASMEIANLATHYHDLQGLPTKKRG